MPKAWSTGIETTQYADGAAMQFCISTHIDPLPVSNPTARASCLDLGLWQISVQSEQGGIDGRKSAGWVAGSINLAYDIGCPSRLAFSIHGIERIRSAGQQLCCNTKTGRCWEARLDLHT